MLALICAPAGIPAATIKLKNVQSGRLILFTNIIGPAIYACFMCFGGPLDVVLAKCQGKKAESPYTDFDAVKIIKKQEEQVHDDPVELNDSENDYEGEGGHAFQPYSNTL